MTEVPTNHAADSGEPIRYPTKHVVGVLDTAEQVAAVVPDLRANGFMDSEIHVHCGVDRADALNASTGRTGLANIAIRIAEKLGIEDTEMERKELYEQAMRDGRFVMLVSAPTDDRKDRAAEMLAKHGAHTVSYHGRFTIQGLVPPSDR